MEKMGQIHSFFGDFTAYEGYQEQKSGHEDWWPHPAFRNRQADATIVPWCAFFADVDHEVEQVTAGVRVTLTFHLRRVKNSDTGTATVASSAPTRAPPRLLASNDKKMVALVSALREYLADEAFLPEGGNIAFPCEHLYTNSQVFPDQHCANDVLSFQATQNLKGRDLVVAQAALDQVGLQVFLKPLVKHNHSSVDQGDYYLTRFPDQSKTVPSRMSDQDIEEFFDTDFQKCAEEMADIWVANIDEGASSKCGECSWNPVGYFGNEASQIEFYVHAFLLIVIPPFQERQQLIPRASLKKG